MAASDKIYFTGKTLISVIIPTFNAEETISQTLDSVLKQTYPNIEIIVVDDGSTDGTPRIAKEYAERDKRCKYIYKQNSGVSSALNLGIENSNGEFIAAIGSDDIWADNKLELQLECIKKYPDSIVLTEVQRFTVADSQVNYLNITTPPEYKTKKEYVNTLLNLSSFQMALISTALLRKSYLEKVGVFDLKLQTAEDWDLWLRLACFYEFRNIQKPLYFYRKHKKSLTIRYNAFDTLKNQLYIMDKVALSYRLPKSDITYAKINKYIEFAKQFAYQRNYSSTIRVLLQGCLAVPIYLNKEFYSIIYNLLKESVFPHPPRQA